MEVLITAARIDTLVQDEKSARSRWPSDRNPGHAKGRGLAGTATGVVVATIGSFIGEGIMTRSENAAPKAYRWGCSVLAALCLTACTSLEDNVTQGYATGKKVGSADVSFTTADVRVIMERERTGQGKIVCSEPSPDIAMALDVVAKLRVAVPTKAEVSGETSATQEITQLVGRSVAVQALRDGTYRACEAFANGAIDRDEYALLLSQYGDVLITIMLGENAGATKSGTSVDTISNNYVAYAAPRLAHAVFVACTTHQNGTSSPFLDHFCASINTADGFSQFLGKVTAATPVTAKSAQAGGQSAAKQATWTIPFVSGSKLTDAARAEILKAFDTLRTGKDAIAVIGHADTVPPKADGASNQAIAEARGWAVAKQLEALGVDGSRITVKGDPAAEPKIRAAIIQTTASATAKAAGAGAQ